jgi:hypothetical protein
MPPAFARGRITIKKVEVNIMETNKPVPKKELEAVLVFCRTQSRELAGKTCVLSHTFGALLWLRNYPRIAFNTYPPAIDFNTLSYELHQDGTDALWRYIDDSWQLIVGE